MRVRASLLLLVTLVVGAGCTSSNTASDPSTTAPGTTASARPAAPTTTAEAAGDAVHTGAFTLIAEHILAGPRDGGSRPLSLRLATSKVTVSAVTTAPLLVCPIESQPGAQRQEQCRVLTGEQAVEVSLGEGGERGVEVVVEGSNPAPAPVEKLMVSFDATDRRIGVLLPAVAARDDPPATLEWLPTGAGELHVTALPSGGALRVDVSIGGSPTTTGAVQGPSAIDLRTTLERGEEAKVTVRNENLSPGPAVDLELSWP